MWVDLKCSTIWINKYYILLNYKTWSQYKFKLITFTQICVIASFSICFIGNKIKLYINFKWNDTKYLSHYLQIKWYLRMLGVLLLEVEVIWCLVPNHREKWLVNNCLLYIVTIISRRPEQKLERPVQKLGCLNIAKMYFRLWQLL